jgi:endonuclease/exonuclease/phosphatase family metal-dependent hydrolase
MATLFTAMTWNVENLFRVDGNAPQEAQHHYQQKLALLASVINRHAPDVVGLQEVGGEDPLDDLQQTLGQAYSHRAISAFPDHRGIRVAFLSKHAIDERVDIVDFPPGPALQVHHLTENGETTRLTRMGRGALHIRVEKDGQKVHLITAHLKSKLLSFPRPFPLNFTAESEEQRAQVAGITVMRRAAEAVTLRIHANALLENNANTRLLLLGDFNDVPEAQTSLILNGPPGSELGTRGFNQADQGDDARLFNLAPLIDPARRFSRIYRDQAELLDQILASVECFPRDGNGRRQLPQVDSLIDFADPLASVEDDPATREASLAPDHAPVVATFHL